MDTRNDQVIPEEEKTPAYYMELARQNDQFSTAKELWPMTQEDLERIKAAHRKQDQRKAMHEALDKVRQKRKEKQEMSD